MSASITLLPGDGIGPEVVAAATRVLDTVGEFTYAEHPVGGAAIDAAGTPLPSDTLAACRASDAVLLGAVGGPKWDSTDPRAPRPEQGLLGLRRERPVRQPAARARCRRFTTRARCGGTASRAPTWSSCAS